MALTRRSEEEIYNVWLKNYLEDKRINHSNKQILRDFFRAADLDQFSRKVGYKRRCKYITLFRHLEEWFNHKTLPEITKGEMEEWYLDLKNGKITGLGGKKISENTKATHRIMVKTLWKWLKGDGEAYPVEVKSFRTAWQKKRPITIRRSDVEKVANSFKDWRYKFAVLFLFDSGFRIDEFLTMKKRNLKVEKQNNGEDYYLAECEVSKTKPRRVSIKLYSDVYNEYLKQYHAFSKDDMPLVEVQYAAFRKALNQNSKKVLGFTISPHILRKSSATYYATILKDPYKLNKRYGWTLNSDVSQAYLDEAGISEEATIELVDQSEISELKKKMIQQEKEKEKLKKDMEELQLEMHQNRKTSQEINKQMMSAFEDKEVVSALLKKLMKSGFGDKLKEDLKIVKAK